MTTLDGLESDVAVVVPAGGAGTRLGAGIPKALCLLAGEPLLVHAVQRLLAASGVGFLVVAAPAGREQTVRRLLARADIPTRDGVVVRVVTGGADRQQSVAAALAVVPATFDIVLVHDAARALVPTTLVESVAAAVRGGQQAVVPVLPVVDTIIQVDHRGGSLGHLDRGGLRAVQTPQGFRRRLLADAHRQGSAAAATDDAGLVARLGVPVVTVPGAEDAFKITTVQDLAYAATVVT